MASWRRTRLMERLSSTCRGRDCHDMHRCQTEVFTAFSKAVLHVALCGDREADGPNAVRKIVRELCSTSAKTRRFWESCSADLSGSTTWQALLGDSSLHLIRLTRSDSSNTPGYHPGSGGRMIPH